MIYQHAWHFKSPADVAVDERWNAMASKQHVACDGHRGWNFSAALLRCLVMALEQQVVGLSHITKDELDAVAEDELSLLDLAICHESKAHLRIRIHLQAIIFCDCRVVNGLGRPLDLVADIFG